MYCTKCGCKNSEDANYCVSCGAVLKPERANEQVHRITEKSEKRRRGSGKRAGTFAVALVVVLATTILVFWLGKADFDLILKSEMEQYEYVEEFMHDTAIAKKDGMYGLVDRQGNLLTDVWYDLIYNEPAYQEAGVFRARKGGKFVLLGEDGKERSEVYDQIYQSENEENFTSGYYYKTENKTHIGLIPYRSGDRWGMINLQGEEVVEPILEDVQALEPLIGLWEVTFEDGKGLINAAGETIVKVSGDSDFYFYSWPGGVNDQGIAQEIIEVHEADTIGRVSGVCSADEVIIPIEYDFIFTKNVADNQYFILAKDGMGAIADENGELLTDFKDGKIRDYNGDAVILLEDDYYGVEDLDGREILPPRYTDLRFCRNQKWGYVWACNEQGKWGSINQEGEQILPFEYDSVFEEVIYYDNEKPEYRNEVEKEGQVVIKVDGKKGVMNLNRNWIIKPQYDYITPVLNGYEVGIDSGEDTKSGFYDRKGNEILPIQYASIHDFPEYQHLYTYDYDKMGIINKNSERIIPVEYDDIDYLCNQKGDLCLFSATQGYWSVDLLDKNGDILLSGASWISPVGTGGRIVVGWPDRDTVDIYDINGVYKDTLGSNIQSAFQNGLAVVEENGFYGYVNMTGALEIDCIFQDAAAFSEDGLAAVSDGNLWGYIDERGNMVTDFIFKEAEPFANGTAQVVMENDESAVISVTGEILA